MSKFSSNPIYLLDRSVKKERSGTEIRNPRCTVRQGKRCGGDVPVRNPGVANVISTVSILSMPTTRKADEQTRGTNRLR